MQQHVVMSTLMSGLRTGNPLADAMITSLVFGAVTFLAARFGAWWKALVDYILAARAKPTAVESSHLWVPVSVRYNVGAHSAFPTKEWVDVDNKEFAMLAWWMTRYVPVVAGTAVVTRTLTSATNVLPDRGQVLSHTFEGRAVKFTRMYDVAKDDVLVNERIELSIAVADGVPILLRLLDEARAEHTESLTKVTWKQMLFRPAVNLFASDPNARVKFNSALTHSTKSFETIVLDDDVKRDLVENISSFLSGEAWYASMGLSYKLGFLLHGPPGTGKSSLVLAIAGMAKADIYSINLSVLGNDGDLDAIFAAMPVRCVVVFEDIDCMGSVVKARAQPPAAAAHAAHHTKNAADDKNAAKFHAIANDGVTLSCLLNHLDGAGSNHGRIFVMTTNHPEVLDPALIRPGRADVHLRLGLCSRRQLGGFFELFFPGVAIPPSLLAIPGDALTPAEVCSTMLQFRRNPARAVDKLSLMKQPSSRAS